MNPSPENAFWTGPAVAKVGLILNNPLREFERVWLGFMTARVTLGVVFVALQIGIYFSSPNHSRAPLLICVAYLMAALAVRLLAQPRQLGSHIDSQWVWTIGVDLVTFTTLQMFQGSGINYAPLYALPVLMASFLGSMLLAMAAAAVVTFLLFAHAAWSSLYAPGDINTYFLQAALTGATCLAIAFIASQLAMRLASVELRAQHSQLAATVQRQVNELVIASLTDAILVVDQHGQIRSANPAARYVLGTLELPQDVELNLHERVAWQALSDVVLTSFFSRQARQSDITLDHAGQGQRSLRVRTQLTAPLDQDAQVLCVVFMQDQREIEARIRAEKLASMGRMSAAVAHEIRNPLAAITQANALLMEDLSDPGQLRLANMVQQNALRLEQIVRDVLHLAQASAPEIIDAEQSLNLPEATQRICRDWKNQHAVSDELLVDLRDGSIAVNFDPEHLRRILINLLDNALRYASRQTACIQISTTVNQTSVTKVSLYVWSDGAPLEPSVEQHLFEPFFSSESRSSGLGLYICRELCASHGASIVYGRTARTIHGQVALGNEFGIVFKTQAPQLATPLKQEPA